MDMAENDWWAVHPCGHKLDLADSDTGPVAYFQHESHARDFCRRMWPNTGEVRRALARQQRAA